MELLLITPIAVGGWVWVVWWFRRLVANSDVTAHLPSASRVARLEAGLPGLAGARAGQPLTIRLHRERARLDAEGAQR